MFYQTNYTQVAEKIKRMPLFFPGDLDF